MLSYEGFDVASTHTVDATEIDFVRGELVRVVQSGAGSFNLHHLIPGPITVHCGCGRDGALWPIIIIHEDVIIVVVDLHISLGNRLWGRNWSEWVRCHDYDGGGEVCWWC